MIKLHSTRLRQFSFHIFNCFVLLIICIAIAEAYFRYKGYQYTQIYAGTVYRFNNQAEYDHPPWSWMQQFDPLKNTFSVNGKQHSRTDGREKWLFLGDSATYGMGVARELSFPSLVQDQFQEVDIINAGVVGFGTRLQAQIYEELFGSLKYRKVILGFNFFNDFRDFFGELNFGVQPADGQRGPQLLRWLRDCLGRSATIKYIEILQYSRPNKVTRTILKLISKMGRREDTSGITADGFNLKDYIQSEYLLFRDPVRPELEYAYHGTQLLLKRMAGLARENKATMYVLMIPSRSMVFEKFYNTDLREEDAHHYFQQRGLDYNPQGLNFSLPLNKIMDICNQIDAVKCIDILPQAKEMGEEFFLPGDDHPSAKGHELLAQELMKVLIR